MTISIRPLLDTDLAAADAILKLAFRDPVSRLHDLQLYRRIQPDGWFVASQADQLVGMVGAANYGVFAHVGLMAVHPGMQRQGIGWSLMQFLLAGLEEQGVPLVMLDASAAGRPLYEKLGFVAYDETCVFRRQSDFVGPERSTPVHNITARDLDGLVDGDTGLFGADRRRVFQALLESLPGRAFMLRDADGQITGYLFSQRNRIGPWVMRHSQDAEAKYPERALLQAALSLPYEETLSLNVPSRNQEALELLQHFGFEQIRTNLHMGRGAGAPPGQRQNIYAQTSLAVG